MIRWRSCWPIRLRGRSWSTAVGDRSLQEGVGEDRNRARCGLAERAGFRKTARRGDTRIAESKDLDSWDDEFLLRDGTRVAETQDRDSWDEPGQHRFPSATRSRTRSTPEPTNRGDLAHRLWNRSRRYGVETAPRQKPERVKPGRSSAVNETRTSNSRSRPPVVEFD